MKITHNYLQNSVLHEALEDTYCVLQHVTLIGVGRFKILGGGGGGGERFRILGGPNSQQAHVGRYKVRKEPSLAKRCEKSGKDAKRAVLWKKDRLCYIELDFDRTDVI